MSLGHMTGGVGHLEGTGEPRTHGEGIGHLGGPGEPGTYDGGLLGTLEGQVTVGHMMVECWEP